MTRRPLALHSDPTPAPPGPAAPAPVPAPARRAAVLAVLLAGVGALLGPLAAPRPAVATGAAAATATALPDFQRECERLIETTDLRGGRVAVSVVDADTGRAFVRIAEEEPMIPASNMKLLTTGAALHVLGPDFRFRTRLRLDGSRLVVHGDGDPGFGDPVLLADTPAPVRPDAPGEDRLDARPGERSPRGLEVDELLDLWVRAVRRAGVRELTEVVVDDRIFDREYVHPAWPANQLSRHYCAGVAGLNFHANVLTFYPRPVRGGGATPGPSIPRAGFLDIENRATADRRRPGTASVERRIGTDQLILMGNVRTAYEYPIRVTVHEPPAFFARLLTERLRAAGVRVGTFGLAELDAPDPAGRTIAPEVVTPLIRVLERANTDSHNVSSEALFKRLAAASGTRPATFAGAAAFVRQAVRDRLGDERLDSRLRVSDGSGLSRDNEVPAALLTAWLRSFHLDEELAPVMRSSLAVMGRTGTLRNRLRGEPPRAGEAAPIGGRYVPRGTIVRAKSGTIDSVSALSGYVIGPRRTLAFSVMVNGYRGSSATARDLQDRVVMLLAEGLAEEG